VRETGIRNRVLLAITAPIVLGAALFQGGCGQTTVVLPSRNLERPTDMTFACLGVNADEKSVSGQPMARCHPGGIFDPPADNPTYRTYAFVTNAERGDLSVIDMSYCRPGESGCWPTGAHIVDLDPDSVGYGAAPLGVLPEVITASQDGCRLVTANRGSCDLTLVNPAALLAPSLGASTPVLADYARTVVPRTSSGRLALAPGEIAFLPQQTWGLGGDSLLCDPHGVEGTMAAPVGAPPASETAPSPWRAVVTFPSCDLIALMDLPSGDILDSIRMVALKAADGSITGYSYVPSGRNPVCPRADCSGGAPPPPPGDGGEDTTGDVAEDGGASDAGSENDGAGPESGDADEIDGVDVDGGAGDGGAADGGAADASDIDADDARTGSVGLPVESTLGVSAMAIHPEGHRIYFGATNAPLVGSLDIVGAADRLAEPASGSRTTLHSGAGGTTRLRLSIDPYAYSKGHDALDPARAEYGRFVAGRHDDQPLDPLEFLYAIARDGSLRVVDVGRSPPLECELAIDPTDPAVLAADEDPTTRVGCFPHQGGTGLRFGSPPQDIAFANYHTPRNADAAVDEQVLNGAFAFVLTSAGMVFILNIDPEPRQILQVRLVDLMPKKVQSQRWDETPIPLTHSLRDVNIISYSSGLGPQSGPPRVDLAPSGPSNAPSLMSFQTCETRINARVLLQTGQTECKSSPPSLETWVYFPNRRTVSAQIWGITWEGDVTGIRITGHLLPSGPSLVPLPSPPLATTITDSGSGFCLLGGVDGDIMTLIGCDTDASCAPGNVCVHSSRVPAVVDGRTIMGMCLRQDMAEALADDPQCRGMLDSFRRYEIVTSPTAATTIVVPRRDEIPRPAFLNASNQWVVCDGNNPDDPTCQAGARSTVLDKFKCIQLNTRPDGGPLRPTDLKTRCLQPCMVDSECRQGRVCVDFPAEEKEKKFCADAAPIAPGCGLDQLVSYKISAGNAFVVSGSVSGRTESVHSIPGPICVVDSTVPSPLVARIPMSSELCKDPTGPTTDASGNVTWDAGFLGRSDLLPNPNPCFVVEKSTAAGGGGAGGTGGAGGAGTAGAGGGGGSAAGNDQPPAVVSAVFQNRELRFVLTDLQKLIPDGFQIRFEVHGGLSPQTVIPSVDAIPGLPARIVLGPVPQPRQGEAGAPILSDPPDVGWFSDLPYMFVVDQRQVSGGRLVGRGQILRITPRETDTIPVAAFESFAAGGQYFPIQ
jgi:hypothetical protein